MRFLRRWRMVTSGAKPGQVVGRSNPDSIWYNPNLVTIRIKREVYNTLLGVTKPGEHWSDFFDRILREGMKPVRSGPPKTICGIRLRKRRRHN